MLRGLLALGIDAQLRGSARGSVRCSTMVIGSVIGSNFRPAVGRLDDRPAEVMTVSSSPGARVDLFAPAGRTGATTGADGRAGVTAGPCDVAGAYGAAGACVTGGANGTAGVGIEVAATPSMVAMRLATASGSLKSSNA